MTRSTSTLLFAAALAGASVFGLGCERPRDTSPNRNTPAAERKEARPIDEPKTAEERLEWLGEKAEEKGKEILDAGEKLGHEIEEGTQTLGEKLENKGKEIGNKVEAEPAGKGGGPKPAPAKASCDGGLCPPPPAH